MSMKTLGVDDNNDLVLTAKKSLTVSADQEAIMQVCQQAAQAQLGEMVFAKNQGIPNFQTIWRKGKRSSAVWEYNLRKTLLTINGVLSVPSIIVGYNNDVLQYDAVIKTVYGEGRING